MPSTTSPQRSRSTTVATLILAIVILVPSLLGFGNKLIELFVTLRTSEDGAFALQPIMNYLLATIGFLFLFIWATMHGMFRDIEQPKLDMLEQERVLDELEAAGNLDDVLRQRVESTK